jgi:hypothetical protein
VALFEKTTGHLQSPLLAIGWQIAKPQTIFSLHFEPQDFGSVGASTILQEPQCQERVRRIFTEVAVYFVKRAILKLLTATDHST